MIDEPLRWTTEPPTEPGWYWYEEVELNRIPPEFERLIIEGAVASLLPKGSPARRNARRRYLRGLKKILFTEPATVSTDSPSSYPSPPAVRKNISERRGKHGD